jgi:glucokinase
LLAYIKKTNRNTYIMKKVAVGIDIGGTNTLIGIVSQDGNVLLKTNITTPSHGDFERYTADLSVAIKNLISEAGEQIINLNVAGIGIGAPIGNYHTGTIDFATNLSFKGRLPVVDSVRRHFPEMPVVVLTNDANAAAMGEMMYGGAKGMNDFVMFTLGTGVGSGIVASGELIIGADGLAGEIGHSVLIPGGRLCSCGFLGHLEAYCAAPGMKRTAIELLEQNKNSGSLLSEIPVTELDSKMIYEAAEKGDKIALEVFEKTGEWLGMGLANTVYHLSPGAIFLFGGPTAAGDLLFKPAKASMEKNLLSIYKNKIEILPSKLNPGDAAIVGASALVWKEIEK